MESGGEAVDERLQNRRQDGRRLDGRRQIPRRHVLRRLGVVAGGAAVTRSALAGQPEAVASAAESEAGSNRSVQATTLTLLPGLSEDSHEPAGDDLHSAMPDYDGKSLDAWFLADRRSTLPDDLDEALALRKTLPEYPGEEFRQYRLLNQLGLSFVTHDDRTIADWDGVALATSEDHEPSYVLVEGELEHGEENAVRDIIDDPELDWFDGKDKLRATITRYDEGALSESSNGVEWRGVEGVRASVIHGGQDTFVTRMKEKFDELGPVEFMERSGIETEAVPAFIVTPPTMYTFVELLVMADGASLVRVWDASPYPRHALYVDGEKRDDNGFDQGAPDGWEPNQEFNARFSQWVAEEQELQTPFTDADLDEYEQQFDAAAAYGAHPVMSYGEDGDVVTADELRLAFGPHFPWD